MPDLRYPIGKFVAEPTITEAQRAACIDTIAATPGRIRAAVQGLTDAQLDTPYRDGGWTVRQVVHHVPDSHLNAYTRLRLTLTEDRPTIKPYDEAKWAELVDARTAPIAPSLQLLEAIHARWDSLWRALTPDDWSRTFVHPEHNKTFDLSWLVQMYAWHGPHHEAHITSLRQRMGWR